MWPALPAFIIIGGALITISPTFIKPEIFSRALFNWSFIIIIVSILLVIDVFFLINVQIPLAYWLTLLLGLFLYIIIIMYSFKRITKIIKSSRSLVNKIYNGEANVDILRVFTRPKKVTEEEVFISKEKKICLVCKNEISRNNYICPDCKTFYCSKCSEALSNLENACWVCNTPFDESKPVKLQEKKEEEIILEDDIHKKDKKN